MYSASKYGAIVMLLTIRRQASLYENLYLHKKFEYFIERILFLGDRT